jgi:D-methionine transport system permease protein
MTWSTIDIAELLQAVRETALMLAVGLTTSVILGGLIGTLLFLWSEPLLKRNRALYLLIGGLVNIVRSFPFVILMIAVSPLSRTLVGTTIGPVAASIPLSVAGIAYFARLVEIALSEVPKGVIEAAISLGAPPRTIVRRVLLSEARAALVLAFAALTISYLSYTAAAGIIGGGGIGDLAIRNGYYRFQTETMVITVAGLIAFVQLVQTSANWLARKLDKRK